MPDPSTVNDQITDSNTQECTHVLGHAAAQSQAVLDAVMAETLGMEMHNAVTSQQSMQLVGGAAVAATCARLLRGTSGVPILPVEPAGPPEPLSPLIPPENASAALAQARMDAKKALTALTRGAETAAGQAQAARQDLDRLASEAQKAAEPDNL